MQELKNALKDSSKNLFNTDIEPEVTRPDERFGDYSTNIALQLAPKLGKQPREIAEAIAGKMQITEMVAKTEVAGSGFINFFLSDKALLDGLNRAPLKNLESQEILVEFGDPNPFKEMHLGHLYSYIVGDAIAGLLEAAGATVKRLSYHGDVGLHVAMAIYGLRALRTERMSRDKSLTDVPANEVQDFLGIAYAHGNDKYERDEAAKAEIESMNQHIYKQDDLEINELHKEGVELSFRYFDKILDLLSISSDRRYFESQTTPIGLKIVRENVGKVFQQSEGAIIYKGEKVGLHTRVFITSKELPTYETKDLGLVELKDREFPNSNRSIVITANEQAEYFKVMLAALAEINSALASKTTHLTHGFLTLTTGKMSSRTGNVYTAQALLDGVNAEVNKKYPDSEAANNVYLAAVKYSMLKHRLGQDIVIDVKESIALEGNSGPYLQYAFVRANSILQKSKAQSAESIASDSQLSALDSSERSLARKIGEFGEVVEQATAELLPSHICTYLYELAQNFNRFYEKNRILGDEREALRLKLTSAYAEVLKNGLKLLNIDAPEHM